MPNGVLCGVVEDNLDPLKIGRLKIRIPSMHGVDPNGGRFVTTNNIEWSYPCIPFYAGYDCGSFIIPPVGTYVWVLRAEGDDPFLIYFGGSYGSGATYPKVMNVLDSSNPNNVSMGQYHTPVNINEVPSDLNSTEYAQSGVIFKSQKGHTIKYSDQDEGEYFEIIDRSGQSIKFECPVSKTKNQGNASRRGSNNTQDGGKINIISGDSKIMIDGNSITINSKSIKLISENSVLEM